MSTSINNKILTNEHVLKVIITGTTKEILILIQPIYLIPHCKSKRLKLLYTGKISLNFYTNWISTTNNLIIYTRPKEPHRIVNHD